MISGKSGGCSATSCSPLEGQPSVVLGGGAINEKRRLFDPNDDSSSNKKTQSLPSSIPQQPDSSEDTSPSQAVFQASTVKSHLLHAIEGLDRYPKYLSRWHNPEDMSQLEQALAEQLQKVQEQRAGMTRQKQLLQESVDRIGPKYPELLHPQLQNWQDLTNPLRQDTTNRIGDETASSAAVRILDPVIGKVILQSKTAMRIKSSTGETKVPTLANVLNGSVAMELDAGALEQVMEEECFDTYSFPVLHPDFCRLLQQYVREIVADLEDSHESLSDLSFGNIRDLDALGLTWLNDLMLHVVVRPLAQHLYLQTELEGNGDLDWRQGYVAAYAADPTLSKPRQRLVPHTDDSEVTLNVCLGEDDFEGGNLRLWGLRGSDVSGELQGEYVPQVGRALIHAGRHLHEVTEVTKGNRFAYILWSRSWGSTRAVNCPCCLLNGRKNQTCICGPRWN